MSLLPTQEVGSRREMKFDPAAAELALWSQTPLIGHSFWPNVANFGNCLYAPYSLLGCTSRSSHFVSC